MNIGTLTATLGVNTVGLYQAEQRMKAFEASAKASMARVDASLKSAGASMKAFGKAANKYLTLPLALIGGASVNAFKKYQESLAKIVGLVGIAKDKVAAWGKEILKISPGLAQGPNELAKALFFITSAGIRGANAMKILKMSAEASNAGLGDTKTVADLATSAINAYGQSNLSAKKAMDILVTTVREGKAEPAELASSMGMVLPIASAMGVKFNEVGAAMAGMTRTGTSASTAAMQLRQILAAFLKPTEKTRQILASMGTSYKRVKAGFQQMGTSAAQFRDIIQKKGLLAALLKLKDLSKTYGNTLMSKVFPNIRALSGVLDLLGKNMAGNVAIFNALKNSSGNLNKALEAVKNTFAYKWRTALAQGKSALVSLGQEVAKAFIPILEKLTKYLGRLTTWFSNLNESTKSFIITIGGILLVVGPVLTVLGLLANSVIPGLILIGGKLIVMFNALKLAMMTNPITAWIAVAGIAAVVLYKLATNSDTAAENQKRLNDEFERGKKLTAATNNLKNYMSAISTMNKRQLVDLKNRLENQKKVEEDYDVKKKVAAKGLDNLEKQLIAQGTKNVERQEKAKYGIIETTNKKIENNDILTHKQRLDELDKWIKEVNKKIKGISKNSTTNITIGGHVQIVSIEQGKTIAALTSKLSILDNISKAYGGTVSVLNSKTDAYRNTIATLIAQGMKPMNPIIQGYIAKLNALVLAQKKAVSPGEKLADSLTKINALQSALGSSYDGVTAKLNIFTNALNRGLQSGGLSIQEYNYLNNTIKKLKAELAKRATNDIFKDTAKSLALANRNSKLFGNSFNKLNVELRIYTNALEQLKSVKGPFTIEQLNMIKLYSHNIELLQAKLEALSRKQQVFNILGNAAAQMAFQIGKSFVDFSNGLSGIVDIVLNAAQQVIDALLATAIVAVIAKNAAMPWGLIGAAVGLGALMALWDSYKAKAVSSAHLAEGGIIPDGYPGDRYPAMLSSREAVIPLDKLPGILEGAFSGGKTRQVKFVINGKVLEAIMDEQNSYNDVY